MPLSLVNKDGQVIEVDDGDISYYTARGWTPQTTEAHIDSLRAEAAKPDDRGLLGTINSAATGILSGLTLGGSDVLLSTGMTPNQLERLREDRAAHSTANVLGQIGGGLAGALAAPVSLLGRTPAGIAAQAADEGFAIGRATGGLRGAAISATAAGAEGAVQAVGSYLSDVALGNRELSAEALASSLGAGFTFGAGIGGALYGVERGTMAVRRMFSRAESTPEAANQATSEWERQSKEIIEANDHAAEVARENLERARAAREQAQLAKDRAAAELAVTQQTADQLSREVSRGVPDYKALDAHLYEINDTVIGQTVPMEDIARHGWYDETGRFGEVTRREIEDHKYLIQSGRGSNEISFTISPTGKVVYDGSRPGLPYAAMELGVPVKVKWSRGVEPSERAVLNSTATQSAARAEREALEAMKDRIRNKEIPGEAADFTDEGLENAAKRALKLEREQEARLAAILQDYDDAKAALDAAQQATGSTAVPSYKAIVRKTKRKKVDDVEDVIDAREIAKHGYFEPPGAMVDAVRSGKAARAIAEGQREPIRLAVTPKGNVVVVDGRHRLAAAIEQGADIKVRWSTGLEPSDDLVFKSGVTQRAPTELPPDASLLERQLAATNDALAGGESFAALGRTRTASPMSPKQLEQAYEDVIDQAAQATDIAAKQDLLRKAASIEEQLKATGGRSVVDDVATMAGVMTRYEQAAARLVEEIGGGAPQMAQASAQAFRKAEQQADQRVLDRTVRAIDDAADAPINDLRSPQGAIAKAARARQEAKTKLAQARAAETEAAIGERYARDAAKKSRAEYEAKRPPDPDPDDALPGFPALSALPVVGPLFSGFMRYKLAQAASGRFAGRVPATAATKAAALVAKTRDKIASAVDKTLGIVETAAPKVRAAAVITASKLERAFDDGEPDAPKDASLPQVVAVRIREVTAAAANPQAVMSQVRREMRDIHDPDLIAATEAHRLKTIQHLADVAPKAPPPNPYSKRQWEPSPAAASKFARQYQAAFDPVSVFEALQQQSLTPEAADTLRTVWPQLFSLAQDRLVSRVGELKEAVPYPQRLRAGLLFDVPVDDSLDPENAAVLQSVYTPPAPAPSPATPAAAAPSIAAPIDMTALYQPEFDRRAQMR